MQKFYKADGTPIEIMTKDDFKYKDLMNELYYTNWGTVEIKSFYFENGLITLRGFIKPKANGTFEFDLIKNQKYFPRVGTLGFCSLTSSYDDVNKVNFIHLRDNGKLSYWLSSEIKNGTEFTIMYPMKLS